MDLIVLILLNLVFLIQFQDKKRLLLQEDVRPNLALVEFIVVSTT